MPGRPAGRPTTLVRRARSIRVTATVISALLAAGVAGALAVGGGTGAPGAGAVGAGPPTGPARTKQSTPSTPSPSTRSTPSTAAVPAGQAIVTGTVTTVTAQGATGPPLTTPLEITVPVRGRGGATFYDVQVDGQQSAVVWNGGVPLGLLGHGAIVPGRVSVSVDGSGSTWSLDGAERIVAPGTYHAAAPVAVGQAGLARPQDSADFSAGTRSVVVTSGGATVHRDPTALHLVGPGSLVLAGTLRVQTASGIVPARRVALPRGSFVIDLVPAPGGGLTAHATLQGPTTVTAG